MANRQIRLMIMLVALVALVLGVGGVVAERRLARRETARAVASLETRAALVHELLADAPLEPRSRVRLKALADRAAVAADARVTLIDGEGRMLADSEVPLARVAQVPSHRERPEVAAALAGQIGTSRRTSTTVGRQLLYVAVPVAGPRPGVVRVATDVSDIEAHVGELHGALLRAGAVALVVALVLSFLVTRLRLRPTEEVKRIAASIASGDLTRTMPLQQDAELGAIAVAVDQMAEGLQQQLTKLSEAKAHLEDVLDAMVEGLLVVDQEGRIGFANARLRGFFGLRGAIDERTVLEVIRNSDLDDILTESANSKDPVAGQISVGGPFQRTLRVHAAGFPAGAGPRLGCVAVFHDITELTRLEQIRRDFVANASHELRTPLTAIRGFTETLLAGDKLSEEERRSYLEVIDRHSRRLSALVADLLELSKIESQKLQLELGEVRVSELASTLVRDFRARFEQKSLDVQVSCEGDDVAWGDARAVEQILNNLLDNAVKYTEAGGQIRVVVTNDERSVRVAVSDTGYGIPERDRERIFERFYRVDKARSRALGGTGLGLSIVKHLVQSMRGEIRVESELGRGSTFHFRVPRAAADARREAAASPPSASGEARADREPPDVEPRAAGRSG